MTTRHPEVERIRGYYKSRRERPRSAASDFVLDERRTSLARIVESTVPRAFPDLRICDVGCGDGGDLEFWRQRAVPEQQLSGTEVLRDVIEAARDRLPRADLRLVEGFDLPFPDRSFDVTWASMVFSSVMDAGARRHLFDEMRRVTASTGVVAIYDFRVRKPTNRDVVAMTDRRIAALGARPAHRQPITPFLPLLPWVLRLPGPMRRAALAVLPRTHAIWVWRRA